MKTKVLLSSILTIAICLSLIAGSTFALFTDSTDFNIAVTSGDVEIYSTAKVDRTYSAKGPVSAHDDKYLKDEKNDYYKHVEQLVAGEFSNGGTAKVDNDGLVQINKITPGDKVEISINTDNRSDVAFRFRYTISVVNAGGLETGMVLTTHSGEEYEAVKSFTSEWFGVVEAGEDVDSKVIALELPVYAGNKYQTEADGRAPEPDGLPGKKSVEYQILVEAVQANAVTTEDLTTVEVYPTQGTLQLALDNNGKVDGNGEFLKLTDRLLIDGDAQATISNFELDGRNIPSKAADGSYVKWAISNVEDGYTYKPLDLVIDNSKIYAPYGTNTSAIALYYNGTDATAPDNVVVLKNNASLVAANKSGNAENFCIQVVSSKLTLHIDDTVEFVRGNNQYKIYAAEGAILNIVVPNANVQSAIAPFIYNEGATITWTIASN